MERHANVEPREECSRGGVHNDNANLSSGAV